MLMNLLANLYCRITIPLSHAVASLFTFIVPEKSLVELIFLTETHQNLKP